MNLSKKTLPHFRKYYLIYTIASVLMVFGGIYMIIKPDPNDEITKNQLKKYVKVYTKTYNEMLIANIPKQYLKDFNFYIGQPYSPNCIISSENGIGIEFKKCKKPNCRITIQTTHQKLEHTIFPNNFVPMKPPNQHKKRTLFTGFDNTIISNEAGYFNDISLNGVKYDYLILTKGKSIYSYWSKKRAIIDGAKLFEIELMHTFNKSPYLRKLTAEPIISDIANKIIKKFENPDYSYSEWKDDYKELYQKAKKYNLNNEFADNIYNFNRERVDLYPEQSWYYNPYVIGLVFLMLSFILPILILLFKNQFFAKKN